MFLNQRKVFGLFLLPLTASKDKKIRQIQSDLSKISQLTYIGCKTQLKVFIQEDTIPAKQAFIEDYLRTLNMLLL